MIYITLNEEGKATGYSKDYTINSISRWDYTGLDHVTQLAQELTEATNETFIPTDAGAHTSPRYDVIKAPKVGDEVSYSFNGDTYPCGTIVSISKTLKKITTSDGKDFYRKGQTGRWLYSNMWTLVNGHKSTYNREV